MTAPDELETTLLEWAKGPYRLSRNECDVVMARLAELEQLARDVAAVHPQNGYWCMWCHVEMNNHELPPGYYRHEPSCVWLRAAADPLHTHNTPETPE